MSDKFQSCIDLDFYFVRSVFFRMFQDFIFHELFTNFYPKRLDDAINSVLEPT